MKILYKILNTVAALALAPVLLFLPLFRFVATVDVSSIGGNQLGALLGGLIGGLVDINAVIEKVTGINIENLPEFYTIREVYDMFFGPEANGAFADFNAAAIPQNVTQFFTAAFILLCVALGFALIVIITGLFTKKKYLTASFAAMGFISTFAANKCFTYIADQLVSGKISMVNILKGIQGLENYQKYLEYLNFDIRIFELSSAYTILLIVFGALVLLNIGFAVAETTQNN